MENRSWNGTFTNLVRTSLRPHQTLGKSKSSSTCKVPWGWIRATPRMYVCKQRCRLTMEINGFSRTLIHTNGHNVTYCLSITLVIFVCRLDKKKHANFTYVGRFTLCYAISRFGSGWFYPYHSGLNHRNWVSSPTPSEATPKNIGK